MAEAEINISDIFRKVPFAEDKAECGYYPDREATNILTSFTWLDCERRMRLHVHGRQLVICKFVILTDEKNDSIMNYNYYFIILKD